MPRPIMGRKKRMCAESRIHCSGCMMTRVFQLPRCRPWGPKAGTGSRWHGCCKRLANPVMVVKLDFEFFAFLRFEWRRLQDQEVHAQPAKHAYRRADPQGIVGIAHQACNYRTNEHRDDVVVMVRFGRSPEAFESGQNAETSS